MANDDFLHYYSLVSALNPTRELPSSSFFFFEGDHTCE